MAMKYIVMLSALIAVTAAAAVSTIPIKDCGSKAGKVTSITLDPAPVGSCTFPKGTNVTATVAFQIDEVTSKLTAVCKGHVVVWVPFPIPNADGCSQGVTCPTTKGSTYEFKTVIPISSSYPNLRLAVQLEFKDDQGQDAICFQFPGEIC